MLASTPEEAVKMLDEAFGRADLDGVLAFYEDEAAMVMELARVARGNQDS